MSTSRGIILSVFSILLSIIFSCNAYAHASPKNKFYIAAAGGSSSTNNLFMFEQSYNSGSLIASNDVTTDFKIGYYWSGRLGYELYNNFTTEVEVLGTRNNIDTVAFANLGTGVTTTFSGSSVIGNIHSTGGLVSLMYEIKNFFIRPYVGGGIGLARTKYRHDVTFSGVQQKIDEFSNTKFAYQFMAGASIPILKKLSLIVDYRYLDMGTLSGTDDFTMSTVSTLLNVVTMSQKIKFHVFSAGLRYYFFS